MQSMLIVMLNLKIFLLAVSNKAHFTRNIFAVAKIFINLAPDLKDNFIQQTYQIFSFLTSIFTFSYRHIVRTLKQTTIKNFYSFDLKLSK